MSLNSAKAVQERERRAMIALFPMQLAGFKYGQGKKAVCVQHRLRHKQAKPTNKDRTGCMRKPIDGKDGAVLHFLLTPMWPY